MMGTTSIFIRPGSTFFQRQINMDFRITPVTFFFFFLGMQRSDQQTRSPVLGSIANLHSTRSVSL
jgi:hypothetical protein